MPELPEVETIRRQLAPLVEGSKLARMEISDPRWSRPLEPRRSSGRLWAGG
jgi:formamidopyrimidine-DNA glycosylase